MLPAKLKKWLFDKSIRKEITGQPPISKLPINPGKNILLLYDCTSQDERTHIIEFKEQLIAQGKSVIIYGYFHEKLDDLNSIPHEVFSIKETTWYDKPKVSINEIFPQKAFDLVINLDRYDRPAISWMAAHIPAGLKAAFTFSSYPQIYDLVFDEPKELSTPQLIQRLRKTLLSISNTSIT
jgi:hypothetical protein